MKKLTMLLICILITILSVTADAGDKIHLSVKVDRPMITEKLEDPQKDDKAVSNYIMRAFGLRQESRPAANTRLKGSNAILLNALTVMAKEVAAGKRQSTICDVPMKTLTDKIRYTAEELGVSSLTDGGYYINSEAIYAYENAVSERMNLDIHNVIYGLKSDLPYDMYWFGNIYSYGIYNANVETDGETIYYGDSAVYRVSLCVSRDYSVTHEEYTTDYDTSYGKRIQKAAANAQSIVKANAGKSDKQKLLAYKKAICDAVSYNNEAASGGMAYGDPWQAVYVFDKDPKTNVVCEGYSKAFKYLCDLSMFKSSIKVTTVSGIMSAGGGSGQHMWNLVNVNGTRYLTDITNCDEGTIGAPDKLFMAGYYDTIREGNYWGYVYKANGGSVIYLYDEETRNLYTVEELSVTDEDDNPDKHTDNPSERPADEPTEQPSDNPTEQPSDQPTAQPPDTHPEQPVEYPLTYKDKYCKYKINDDLSATVTGPVKKSLTKIVIPATIKVKGKTMKVTGIAKNAFKGMKKLTKVEIGKNIKTIGKNAFSGCKKLSQIVIKTKKLTAESVGNGAFKTGCTAGKVKVPKNKVKEYQKMLQKKGLKKGIKVTK